jgi:hypothetical protein
MREPAMLSELLGAALLIHGVAGFEDGSAAGELFLFIVGVAILAERIKQNLFPAVEDPANPPLRPERHVANSIATIRKRLTFALVKPLYQCPCCKAIQPANIAYHNSS